MASSVDSVHCKATSIFSPLLRTSVNGDSVTGGFWPSAMSRCKNSGMPPGWVRSKVSLVISFLKVIFKPLWMYDMSSRCSRIQLGVELRRLENVGVRLEIDGRAVAAEGADLFQLAGRLAALERLLPLEAVAANRGDRACATGR